MRRISPLSIIFTLILMTGSSFVYGQLTVSIASETELTASEASIHISGDLINQGTLSTTDTRWILNGSNDQSLFSTDTLNILILDKAAGNAVLRDSLIIADSLVLLSGKLISTPDSILFMLSNSGVSGGGAASFVDGPMARVNAVPGTPKVDSLFFPTGDNLDYRPVKIIHAYNPTPTVIFTVEQINQDANQLSSNFNNLDKVSTQRYWHITQQGTMPYPEIQFTYDTLTTNDGVEIATELKVAYLDTSDVWVWNNAGGSGSTDYAGTIISDNIDLSGSGYFTFGDASGGADISLPVVLSLFNISEQRGEVFLSWRSESEINNSHWQVQRKFIEDTTTAFETIARLDGQGSKPSATEYAFTDNQVLAGREYSYRLVDVSLHGFKHYHPEQAIIVGLPQSYQLHQNYPNPFNPLTNILYDLPVNSQVTMTVYNILGQKVATLIDKKQEAGYYKLIWEGKNQHGNRLASGMYILAIHASGTRNGKQETFANVKKLVLVK